MRIALISPRGKVSNNSDFMQFWESSPEVASYRKYFTGASVGLLTIASLIPKDWKIDYIDENIDIIDFNKNYDIVALSSMTQQAIRAYEIADEFRKRNIKVVIGGIHATVSPDETKEHADSVIIGEGEGVWPGMVRDILNNRLGKFYKAKNFFDLTKSPVPRYDLLNKEKYNTVWVQTSRGCPNDCEFCCASNIYGYKFRFKNISQILRELNTIIAIWGKNILINFSDDNMFINKKFAIELIKEIKKLKIRWFAQTDISVSDDRRFLDLIKESGCAMLFIGFETLNYKNFNLINKNGKKQKYLKKYSEIISEIQKRSIGVMGSFIVGLDEDNVSVFKKTTDFIIENNLYATQISVLTPLPGTRLRRRILDENRLLPFEWDNYTFTNVNFKPKNMSARQLEEGLFNMYKKVYSYEVRLKKVKYFRKIYLELQKKEKK